MIPSFLFWCWLAGSIPPSGGTSAVPPAFAPSITVGLDIPLKVCVREQERGLIGLSLKASDEAAACLGAEEREEENPFICPF